MKALNNIVLSKTEPDINCLWLKPVGNGYAFYVFDGRWIPLKIVDDMNTDLVDDDVVTDLSELGNIDEKVKTEVTKQVEELEINSEVGSTDVSDDLYPDTGGLFGL